MNEILTNLMTVLSEDLAHAVIEYRRVTIRKPLTAYAAKLLAKEFAKCPDPSSAADEMIQRNWQGFRADWIAKSQQRMSITDAGRSFMEGMNGRRTDQVGDRAPQLLSLLSRH